MVVWVVIVGGVIMQNVQGKANQLRPGSPYCRVRTRTKRQQAALEQYQLRPGCLSVYQVLLQLYRTLIESTDDNNGDRQQLLNITYNTYVGIRNFQKILEDNRYTILLLL